ncbi:MAG TPA: 3'-5' exonuclease, partial [Bacteroidota bacterium]|nr:3'-5' exonuclease [Bacteroidota bacterium]
GATASIPAKNKKTLTVNYRSATDLVSAVTQLFTYRDKKFPFFDGGKTGFPNVRAYHEKGKDAAVLPGSAGRSAFHWFLIPEVQRSAAEKSTAYGWRKDDAAAIAVKAVADEITMLVPHPEPGPGELTHGDIAVLVRTHDQATTVQTALQNAGIPSIIKAMGNVFGSDSAMELLSLLRAVVSPGNESLLSTALISESIGHSAAGLVAIKNDTATYAKIAQPFFELREIWEKAANGFIRMAMELLYNNRGLAADGKSIAEHLLVYTDAERRLTDMLHLIELVHQESILHPGTDHLLRWLEEQIADATADSEEASIRLESDAKRVQIVTIHSSKGLEYPVVFCPFVWDGREVKHEKKGRSVIFFHREQGDSKNTAGAMPVLAADIGSPEKLQHFERMKQEAQSEAIRMLYVALTRARQRCYVVWGQANQMQHAALTWLLFGDRCSKSAPIRELSYQDIMGPVKDLKKLCGKAMSVSMLDADSVDTERGHVGRSAPVDGPYGPRQFARGPVLPSWNFASYTSLTNEWITSGRDVDAATEGSVIAPAEAWSIFSFPAGARTGKMWHQLCERLDFQGTPGQIDAFVETTLRRNGFQSEFAPALSRMVTTALDVPLGPPHLTLRSVQNQSCVRELDFVYHVNRFTISQVRSILQNPAYGLSEAFYKAAVRLKEKDIQGFMIGTIDLLAESGGTYYLLDYKSNHLGNSFERYAAPALANVMAEGHYYLQYLIYTIAVHRYLRARVPGYSYETHFGGVFYLFLRGMRPGDQSGVFFNRPPLELIQTLETCLTEGGRG